MAVKFLVCVSREGFGDFSTADLTLGRLYEAIEPEDAKGMIRIVDDSGEDYLYPAKLFESVDVDAKTAQRLHSVLVA